MKKCRDCHQIKPFEEFYKKVLPCKECFNSKRRRSCVCKFCKKTYKPEKKGRGRFCSLSCRFFSKVKKDANEKGCWEWQGGKIAKRYGGIQMGATINELAHRVSYLMHKGEVPEHLEVCHHCDNGFCVNPDHLFLGTHTENMQDASRKKRWSKKPNDL